MSATIGCSCGTTLCSHAHCIRETRPFKNPCAPEAEFQVRRLRNRTCLALWCGNNELELLNAPISRSGSSAPPYDAIFRRILPEAGRGVRRRQRAY